MIKNSSHKALLVGISLTLSLSGCVWIDNTDDLVRYVADVQARPSRPLKPLPEFESYEAFVYEGSALRNPFVAIVKYVVEDDDGISFELDLGNTPAPDEARFKAYLEGFSLNDLTMVGTIRKGKGGQWALIVDANGEIHRVAAGDYVGLDHGQVLKVTAQKIKLIETISNGRGGWITRPRSIEIVESKGQ